ncbi:YbaB/EbfC family nucleoid-associated protein [Streptomyces sp. NPDC048281]|uniref:YbaB/EbfC family nucleoid-associated protein n=1 Tax=Streptomyces sp. NPDC048281 TaxID=3154715 RepID=UPI00343074C6
MPETEQSGFAALALRARQMQTEVLALQERMSRLEATGHGGGGRVTATLSGEGQLIALDIHPSVIDPDNPSALSEMVIAALNAAGEAMTELRSEFMGSVTTGVAGLIEGMRDAATARPRVTPRFAPHDRIAKGPGGS